VITVNNATPGIAIDGVPRAVTGTCGTQVIAGLSLFNNLNGGAMGNAAFDEVAVLTRAPTAAEIAAYHRWASAQYPA
jgi:hypothetical protein